MTDRLKERLVEAANDLSAVVRERFGDPETGETLLLREAAARITQLEAEVERLNREADRWVRAYQIAHAQAMDNGAALADARAALHQGDRKP